MYLRFGSYVHPLGEAAVLITKESLESDAYEKYAVRERWTINGMLIGTSPSDMRSKIRSLETVYATGNKDVTMLLPDRSESTHKITNSACIGGVRVIQPPSFPDGNGAEHVTKRQYTIVLEGIVVVATSQVILSFEESLSFSGGGSLYGHLVPLEGPPIKQLLKQQTPYRVTQEGQAVGLFGYPDVPYSLLPGDQIESNPRVRRYSPKKRGGQYYEYKVTWSYEFEAAYPLYGTPHRWTY